MQFNAYSQYYDLLYQDKDYAAETEYVIRLLNAFCSGCSSVLELGCGTGKHASLLARGGLHVTGVELSETMLIQSRERAAKVSAEGKAGQFIAMPGDARTVRIEQQFDAVVSLFHVVSYQTTNNDVRSMFETAGTHLRDGGVFLFDVWYGPAVVTMRPTVRIKRMESSEVTVLRIAEPAIDMNLNRVEVTYTVFVTEKKSGHVVQLTETHPMRYYFAPELSLLAEDAGFELVRSEEWMTGRAPSESTWGVTFIARKR
jgi:SAM-dependent methyltransferase